MGLLVWLGFHWLLLPGRYLKLAWRSVRIVWEYSNFSVTIHVPKARKTVGRRQHAIVDDPFLYRVFSRLEELRDPVSLICLLQYEAFYRRSQAVCHFVWLRLTPSSLRAGGAAHVGTATHRFHDFHVRGHWSAASSLER